MKEALPAYPDDDEDNDPDSQKNYATVSLCCLSVTNPFRNKIIQIVSVNPWFDRFILFVILVNCMFLALDKEVDSVTDNIETIDFVFLLIYTWEMTFKIIAMGFFMRTHSYLRDSWNIVSTFINIFEIPTCYLNVPQWIPLSLNVHKSLVIQKFKHLLIIYLFLLHRWISA